MRNSLSLWILPMCLCAPAYADSGAAWDSSGNGLLNGTWNFRHVLYYLADQGGDLFDAASAGGQITFDGNGHYSLSGSTVFDLTLGISRKLSGGGNYAISASGFGYLDSPLEGGDRIYALVSASGLIGSTTETGGGYNDLFVATQASPIGMLPGTYAIAYYSPSFSAAFTSSALIQMTSDGMGNLVQSTVNGFTGGGGPSGFTGALTGATYTFANGAGTLNLPDASIFAQTAEPFWVSPDGGFLFGGAAEGLDIFVGIRIDPAPGAPLSGLYLEAGIDEDTTNLAGGVATLATWYGSLNAGAPQVLHHRRLNTALAANPTGLTFADPDPTGAQYIVSPNGTARVGVAGWPHIGIQIAMAAPAVSGAGVFLNPQGMLNAASAAPFTAGISAGEWITLDGSNLASSQASAPGLPMPLTLAGAQVLINGVAAPLGSVSPAQISVLVPQGTLPGIATIQVIADGIASNTVTALVNRTTPGAFMADGSYAVAIHGDYSMVTPANPAQPGETIAVYVDGMGPVSSPPADGTAAAASPLCRVTGNFTVDLDGTMSPNIEYEGLSPGLAATYQVNFQIPPGTAPGDRVLGITGPDSRTAVALVSVGAGAQ